MKVRFQADADFNEDIVTGVLRRRPEIDFQTASEAGVLALCSREGRILVSHDRRTMPGYFADFISTRRSPGVFIVQRSTELAAAIEALLLVWEASEAEEYVNSIRTLPL